MRINRAKYHSHNIVICNNQGSNYDIVKKGEDYDEKSCL